MKIDNKINWNNKDEVLKMVSINGLNLKNAPLFQNDEEVVFAAIKNVGYAAKYASVRWRNNSKFMLCAMKNHPSVYAYASEFLKKDANFLSQALLDNKDRNLGKNVIRSVNKNDLVLSIEAAQVLVEIASDVKKEYNDAKIYHNRLLLDNRKTYQKIAKSRAKYKYNATIDDCKKMEIYSQARLQKIESDDKIFNDAYKIYIASSVNTRRLAKLNADNSEPQSNGVAQQNTNIVASVNQEASQVCAVATDEQ